MGIWSRFWGPAEGEGIYCTSSADIPQQTVSYNCEHCYDGDPDNCGHLGDLDGAPSPWFDFMYYGGWGEITSLRFQYYRVGRLGIAWDIFHSGGVTRIYSAVEPPELTWITVVFPPLSGITACRLYIWATLGWASGYFCQLEFTHTPP